MWKTIYKQKNVEETVEKFANNENPGDTIIKVETHIVYFKLKTTSITKKLESRFLNNIKKGSALQ